MMKTDIAGSLSDWFAHIGLEGHLSPQEIESGRAVGHVMKSVVDGYNLDLLPSTSAVNRVTNWNSLIAELKKIGIHVTHDDKNKIINGNHQIVFHIISRLKDYHQKSQKETEVDISKLNLKSELTESGSLLELLILAIMKHFSLNAKESVALLSNESKYLAHILAKGLKGDFKPIEGLLIELQRNIELINDFAKNKENELFFIRSIKPALISKSENASEIALSIFEHFLQSLPHRYDLIKEHLINTFILAIKRHSHLSTRVASFLLEMSNYHPTLLNTLKPQASPSEFQNLFLEMWSVSKQRNTLDLFYEFKGLRQIISNCIANIKNTDTVLSSMNILINLCNSNSELLVDQADSGSFVDNVQQVVLSDFGENLTFIHQLFSLLYIFGRDKNPIAPSIFKTLVGKYQESVSREESQAVISNFEEIIKDFPSIPFGIIVETMGSRFEANTLKITEVQLRFFELVVEIDLLDIKNALMIYNIVSKVVMEETHLCRMASEIILSLLRKFTTENIFMDMTVKLIKVSLSVHFANVRKLSSKRKSLTGGPKGDLEDSAMRSKNVSIEGFIYQVADLEFADINPQIEPLVSFSILQIEKISKDPANGLRKVLELFGNAEELLKKYEQQAKKMEQDAHKKEEAKRSKLKDSSWGMGSNRYDRSPDNRASSNIDDGRKRTQSKNENPLYLSFVGVTPSAQKGLEKYHKVYLQKLERIEQEKNKQTEIEERELFLKKVFERKMLDKGIEVKKINSEDFRYVYEFDQKEKEMAEDQLRGKVEMPFYENDNEEDRDVKALEYLFKKYQRVLKVYFGNYSGNLKPKKAQNFSQISEFHNLICSAGVWKLIKDHSLDDFISVREAQDICKRINKTLKKDFIDFTALDYEGFEQFILQASYVMFTRPPKDLRNRPISEMVEETISHLKLYSTENRINQQLFEDPDNIYFNETEAVRELNKKLAENPDYILPEGYKKVVEKKVLFTHQIFLDAMSPTYKAVYEVINEILFSTFNINIIEPFTTSETVAKARPSLYFNQRIEGGDVYSQRMSVFLKKEVLKIPIKDREIGKQAGVILDNIIEAVELGHEKIRQRHQNKLNRDKKQKELEAKKLEEEDFRKRAQRDKFIKSALTKHKQTAQTKKKEEKQKVKEERAKLEEEKKRKKKEEEEVKKKVEEYQKGRRAEEQKKRKESLERKKREKEEIEKRVKELEETKKKKEELRKEKEEEDKERKKEEARASRRRQEEQKKTFQEERKKKKQLIEEYKNKKSALKRSKVQDPVEEPSEGAGGEQ